MNQAQRDEIYIYHANPETRKYIDLLETMGRAATQLYGSLAHMQYPPQSLEQLRQALVALGWVDEEDTGE